MLAFKQQNTTELASALNMAVNRPSASSASQLQLSQRDGGNGNGGGDLSGLGEFVSHATIFAGPNMDGEDLLEAFTKIHQISPSTIDDLLLDITECKDVADYNNLWNTMEYLIKNEAVKRIGLSNPSFAALSLVLSSSVVSVKPSVCYISAHDQASIDLCLANHIEVKYLHQSAGIVSKVADEVSTNSGSTVMWAYKISVIQPNRLAILYQSYGFNLSIC